MISKLLLFEKKFGWSELIATIALIAAVIPQILSHDPLKELVEKSPKLSVMQAESKGRMYSLNETAFHITLDNVGEYPAQDIQFVFDVYYLNKAKPTESDIRLFLDPQVPYKLTVAGDYAYLVVAKPLLPGETLGLIIFGKPIGVNVMTPFGNIISLSPSAPITLQRDIEE